MSSYLAQTDVLMSLVVLAAWCYVWSRGHFSRAKQRKWLRADAALFSSALLSNLALIATDEPVFKLLLAVSGILCGLSLTGRLVVALTSPRAGEGSWRGE